MYSFTGVRGFTLIELLVVISIVGMLSAIVMSSMSQARTKGSDAGIKNAMNQFRSQFDILSLSNGHSFANLCTNTSITKMLTNLESVDTYQTLPTNVSITTAGANGKITCHSTATGWAVEAPMSSGFWCIDNTGKAATTSASSLLANDTICK